MKIITTLVLITCLSGCHTVLKGDGGAEFYSMTSVGVRQTAPDTGVESTYDVLPSVWDVINKLLDNGQELLTDDKETPAPGPTPEPTPQPSPEPAPPADPDPGSMGPETEPDT